MDLGIVPSADGSISYDVTHLQRGLGGLFSVHGNPTVPLDETEQNLRGLHKIVIDESYRDTLRSELSFYGINSVALFPDLDGLSNFLNWTVESKEYWRIFKEEEAK